VLWPTGFCAWIGWEYGAADIIIGLWFGTMPGCCRLLVLAWGAGPARVVGTVASVELTGWLSVVGGGCSWGLRQMFCM
jgi:hypothetical protein